MAEMPKEQIKKELSQILKKWGVVNEKTVGKITLDINNGGIREIHKNEKLA